MPVKAFMEYIEMMDKYVLSSTTDLEGKITSASQAFCTLTGYSEIELIGKKHSILRDEQTPDSVYQSMWSAIRCGETWQGELRNKRRDGSHFWVHVHIKPNYDTLGNIVGYTAVRQDITDHKRVQELMLIDELTQAYNRRYFNQVLHPKIESARLAKRWLGFLMIDADNFKKYNDTYGHQMGDEVLVAISRCLKAQFVQPGDTVFRLGGEEFCVLYNADSPEALMQQAQLAREAMVAQNIAHSGNPPLNIVTLSMGLMALDPGQHYVDEEIYKYADEALYKAKQNGRNRVEQVHLSDEESIELF